MNDWQIEIKIERLGNLMEARQQYIAALDSTTPDGMAKGLEALKEILQMSREKHLLQYELLRRELDGCPAHRCSDTPTPCKYVPFPNLKNIEP